MKIAFIEPSGRRVEVEGRPGEALVHSAQCGGVAGIEAQCGGSGICGTCHCRLVEAPAGGPAPADAIEIETIDFLYPASRPGGRLICQIEVTADLDGAVFAVATGAGL